MRGKPIDALTPVMPIRNIPAYAGKTTVAHARQPLQTEHPRVCGENGNTPQTGKMTSGTSPRMRGKPAAGQIPPGFQRNIPAYAGKTLDHRRILTGSAEHPRVCGENVGCRPSRAATFGTSPRMRGKPLCILSSLSITRNIPAYAGKTRRTNVIWPSLTEHPRVCGENSSSFVAIGLVSGTSPRMRGKLRFSNMFTWSDRNIPAYAGKTLIDVRFLVPEGHFTFGFVFLYRGGSVEFPCSSLLSECFSDRIVVYDRPGTSLLSAYGCAFWWDGE